MGQIYHNVYFLGALRACAWLFILTVIFVPLEQLFAVHPKRIFRKSTIGDLGFYFLSSFLPHLVLIAPLAIAAYFASNFVPRSLLRDRRHVAALASRSFRVCRRRFRFLLGPSLGP